MGAGRKAFIALLIVLVLVAVVGVLGFVVFPAQTAAFLRPVFPSVAEWIQPSKTANSHGGAQEFASSTDASDSGKREQSAYQEARKGRPTVYPLVAECEGVEIRSTVAPADLTAVLFHQASYEYALEMNTELPTADLEGLGTDNPPRVNNDQLEGEWLDADAMHIWRMADTTSMDTSVDIGAEAGTVLRAPVTGTVVLVKDYMLFDETPDVEIHIQPDGHPELDVVMIHNVNPLVKAGQHVEAGVTEMCSVRDIASALTDIQLAYYTEGDDPGNHSHVQVNDANYKDYREKKLEGAITL